MQNEEVKTTETQVVEDTNAERPKSAPIVPIGPGEARLFGRKVIYIETVANVHTPSVSGKLMYKIANEFYIQWEELLEVYPNAIVGGCLF